MKTTKADVDVLYSGQTFKFGITQNKDKIHNKEDVKDNLKDDNNPIKANPMPLFSKSSDNSSQITVSDSAPFTFGSTLTAKPTTTSTAEPVFRFGLTTNKPIDVKPTESSMTTTTSSEALAPNKAINLFEFGAQTSSIITPMTSVTPGFTFGIQNKPNKESETEKSVSFESQKNSKSSEPLEAENKPTSELNFQLKKPIEEKSQLFSFGPNTTTGFSFLNSSIFGSKTAASSGVVTTVSPSTTSLSNTFNQLPNITPNKSMNAFFGLPVTTTSSPSLLSSSLLINNNKLNTGLTSIQPIQTVTTTSSEETGKTLFSSNSSAIKPFDTLIANNTSQTPIVSTSTVTSTTSSQQNSLVFGNSNNNLQSLSSIASNVNTTKPNFSFNVNASAGHQDSSFAPNKLFASSDSKAFAFGNAPLSSSQTGFSFTLPTTNATPLTSSTISFGLNSNNSNTNNNAKSSTDSLFTFGQNSEPFASSIAQKAPNSINSPQFNFGANQTTGQNTNIFGNAMNSSQSSLSFNPTSLTTNTNSTPFSFGFGATQSTPSVPQLQAQQQQQQQQPLPPPQYNFSQQPTFDFARMNSTENQSSPLFQFSAEPTAGRSYKKAKRRLHPT